jgi:hypothetical protein
MITKIKEATIYSIRKEWVPVSKEMNIVKAATDMFIRITHSCLFGKHEKDFLIKQFKDGAEIREPVGQALQKVIVAVPEERVPSPPDPLPRTLPCLLDQVR